MPIGSARTGWTAATEAYRSAWEAFANWDKPTLTLISERLATRGFNPKEFHEQMAGTAGQPHTLYTDTGFFLIEDAPVELAQKTIEFIELNPLEQD